MMMIIIIMIYYHYYIRLLFSILVTLNDIMKSRKYLIVINCIKKVNCFA